MSNRIKYYDDSTFKLLDAYDTHTIDTKILSVNADANTIALRDSNGDLTVKTLKGNATSSDRVKIDSSATADYIGANYNDGIIRIDTTGLSWTDGGNFITISHKDTSNQISSTNINGNVIQNISLDTLGHITSMTSLNLDLRYSQNTYTKITDGINTSNANSLTDTFKLRTSNNILSIVVADNDSTHGDNALFTINQGNIDHGSISGNSDDDHVQYVHVSTPRTISAVHTFSPPTVTAPFKIASNAFNQLVLGLNADTVDGYQTSINASPNTIVVRDNTGYIQNVWFNSSRGSENSTAAQYIYDTGDGYMRKKDLANVKTEIVTSNAVTNGLGYTPLNKNGDTMNGTLQFDIVKNASSKGMLWCGLTDTHSIFVEEYANAENTRLVIQNEDNGDSDYTVFRNNAGGVKTDIFEIHNTYVKSNSVMNSIQGYQWNGQSLDERYTFRTSANRPGVTKLYRRDDDSNFNVQTNWTGTRWRLKGYQADNFHAECEVGYADSAGNADTVDGHHFNWSGQSGQPTWLWGGNDSANMYLYNPSNFNVSYAKGAGNSDTVDNLHAESFTKSVGGLNNSVTIADNRNVVLNPKDRSMGIYFDFISNSIDGLADGGTYHGIMTFRQYGSSGDWSGGTVKQLGFTDNNNLWIRQSTGDTTWNSWSKMWHSSNFNPNNKLEASVFNTHNNDNTRHITGAERTAWNNKWDYNAATIAGVKSNNAGLADAAIKLQTARTINGVAFDGTSNITISSVASSNNADTVDNLHGSQFMRNDANTYTSGRIYVTGGTGTAYDTSPLEIRVGGKGDEGRHPRISFHRSGIVASQIGMDINGHIRTYNNPGTAYEVFRASTIYSNDKVVATVDQLPTKLSQLSKDINFDERYYTESEVDSKLNTKADNHNHPYLQVSNPSTLDVNNFTGSGAYLYLGSSGNWSNKGPTGHNGSAFFSMNTHPGDYYSQLWFDTNRDDLYLRTIDAGIRKDWRKVWHSGNFNPDTKANNHDHPYIPTSASCNKNWNWSGQEGQPTWLWGGNDGTNMYVYNPFNFHVKYAENAQSAEYLSGIPASNYLLAQGRPQPLPNLLLNTQQINKGIYCGKLGVNFFGLGSVGPRVKIGLTDAQGNFIDGETTLVLGSSNKIVATLDKIPSSLPANGGNADTASKLQTARTISLSGSVTGSANFDGSGNITIDTTMAGSGVKGGIGNFAGNSAEKTIAHGFGKSPTTGVITPIGNQSGTVGEYWIRWDSVNIYVGNTGSSTRQFSWMVG